MVEIKESIIPISLGRSGQKLRSLKGIIVHNTGNSSKGSGAYNHARYLQNNCKLKALSWHYTVDDKEIYQHVPIDEVTWQAGDGNGDGNYCMISIEICMNSDGDILKATNNAVDLIVKLCKEKNLKPTQIYQHNKYSPYKKNCPQMLRANKPYSWDIFIDKIEQGLKETNTTVSKPTTNADKNKVETVVNPTTGDTFKASDTVILNGYLYGNSYGQNQGKKFTNKECKITKIVDTTRNAPYLLDNGLGWVRKVDIKFKNTTANSITTTNVKPPQTVTPINYYPKCSYNGMSLVDGLKSIGVNSSFANRSKIAKANGVTPYLGTSTQNSNLLVKLKQGKLKKV